VTNGPVKLGRFRYRSRSRDTKSDVFAKVSGNRTAVPELSS
jgi:hypothetical protein